ncbi:SMP-30/gluconolactonase/LRE family protein [Olivibacter sitiensis]|uniref:SMP-30/gluconolactonase/LRE family protein n=1 Tax=Olivibacter sitiensis TaxID=376470 RepID=UPI000422B5E4|nr:SMP-30/gluconolactonase/LRE family protein [Olivibacter sitiensis]
MKIEIAVGINCQLGEGPLWDAKRRCLHFVDILSARFFSYYPHTNRVQTHEAPGMVGALALCRDGRLLAAVANGFYYVDPDSEAWTFLLHPEDHLPSNRYNDGKCDALGRFWIGSMHLEEKDEKGALYLLDSNLSYKKVLDNTTISNGMEWDREQRWYYHIDSQEKAVNRFAYDAEQGIITKPERIILFGDKEGVPDGMTIDTEGMLWIAHFGGGCISRRNPDTGEISLKIDLPVTQVTSCTFGGKHLSDLYITTAAKGLSKSDMLQQPQAGYTFVIKDIGYKGYKPNAFGN